MTDTLDKNSNKNSTNLLVSVLVLLVTILTISVVALVSYYSMTEQKTLIPPTTQDSSQITAPAPIDEREDVKIWSDSTGIGVSKLLVAVSALRAEDTPVSTTDRCAYMLTVLEGLNGISKAPVEQLDSLYRTWVTSITTVIKQCAETINATGDFSNQTKIAIDSTSVHFSAFNTELSKYVDLNR